MLDERLGSWASRLGFLRVGAMEERAAPQTRRDGVVRRREALRRAPLLGYSGLFSPRINLSPFTKDFRGKRRQMSLDSISAGKSS